MESISIAHMYPGAELNDRSITRTTLRGAHARSVTNAAAQLQRQCSVRFEHWVVPKSIVNMAYWDVSCGCYQKHPFCVFPIVDVGTDQRRAVLLWPSRFGDRSVNSPY